MNPEADQGERIQKGISLRWIIVLLTAVMTRMVQPWSVEAVPAVCSVKRGLLMQE